MAMIAPRGLDVRAVISRFTVVSVMLTLAVVVADGAAAGVQVLTGHEPGKGWYAVIVCLVAARFHPVLLRVQTTTDELLFGGRADPVDTLSRLGTDLSAGSLPKAWLSTLRAALAVPAIELRVGGELIAESGDPVDGAGGVVTELRVGSDDVDDLLAALSADQLRMPATTQAVLRLVAGPLGQAVQATRLTEQLRHLARPGAGGPGGRAPPGSP
jgi:hypothetical protein